MTNSYVMTATFGVTTAHPASMTLKVTFTESAVDAARGTSTVKAVVQLINNTAAEHWYRHNNGRINVTVAGLTKQVKKHHARFDVRRHRTVTKATLVWTGVNHRPGSCAISMSASWPTGTAGAATVGLTSATLVLDNAPAPPTAPVWPASNSVGPTGTGTSTYLNWLNMENVSRSGIVQSSPYAAMYLHVCQASFPDHFNPVTTLADISDIAGGTLGLGFNYAVQTFWYTSLGKTLPSLVVYYPGVAAGRLIVVQPPANAPKNAIGWGLAVSASATGPADANAVTVQSQDGSQQIPLGRAWTEPAGGLSSNGGPPPTSSFADTMAWSQNTVTPLTGPPWPASAIVPTIGGFWYQFFLVVTNDGGSASLVPQTYFVPGASPSLGAGTTGDSGDGTDNVDYAPEANIAVIARALNRVNLTASVVPTVAQVIDFATASPSLTESPTQEILINYCSDPRAYWLTASTAGNTTASPYVAEVSGAGFTSHNAQQPPQQMLYALAALGLAEVDRGQTQTFVAANNNTGSQVSHYVYVGGNPDTPNSAAAHAIPPGAGSVQVSAMAWINSANAAPGRAVTPFAEIRLSALYANGVAAGSNSQAIAPMPVNTLRQLSASWALPANTARVVAALVANTAAGAAWNGGYQAGDSITTTGFMVMYDSRPTTPYFDGGFPTLPASNFSIITGGNLQFATLASIPDVLDGHAPGVP